MFPLDPKTVERAARVIVDVDGPYQRKGWELEQLLRHAGWTDPPEYDGSARVPWLVEQMEERGGDRAAIEQLLCRACDPLEYDEGIETAEEFRRALNEKLEPERLTVTYVAGRPVVAELDADGATPLFSEPPDLELRLTKLIRDPETVKVLVQRARETRMCESAGAYTLAVIGVGSFVEGLLLAMLTERDEGLRVNGFVDRRGRRANAERAGLEILIDTARGKDWIQFDATGFMHKVRDYRNFIHPSKELAEQPQFDRDSVALCWAPVQAVLNDLEQRVE